MNFAPQRSKDSKIVKITILPMNIFRSQLRHRHRVLVVVVRPATGGQRDAHRPVRRRHRRRRQLAAQAHMLTAVPPTGHAEPAGYVQGVRRLRQRLRAQRGRRRHLPAEGQLLQEGLRHHRQRAHQHRR